MDRTGLEDYNNEALFAYWRVYYDQDTAAWRAYQREQNPANDRRAGAASRLEQMYRKELQRRGWADHVEAYIADAERLRAGTVVHENWQVEWEYHTTSFRSPEEVIELVKLAQDGKLPSVKKITHFTTRVLYDKEP